MPAKLARTILFCTISCICFLASGCASMPHNTGYLRNYNTMMKGTYLDKAWFDASLLDGKKYSKIYVESIKVNKIPDMPNITDRDCKLWLEKALKQYSNIIRQHITFYEHDNNIDAELEIIVVEIDPGSAAGRMIAGELGLGHAWIQVEGKIIDAHSKETIFSFADRKRDSGLMGLEDLAGDQGPNLVRRMLEQIVENLFNEIKEVFKF